MNYEGMYTVFVELSAFVEGEPRLVEFAPQVAKLREHTLAVARGQRFVPVLEMVRTNPISDRVLAERIVAIVNRLPPVDPSSADLDTLRIVGQLLGNLATAITHAVLRDFPELVTSRQ